MTPIYTEFVVLHADGPMPDEERFAPSFWRADDFDADGDYYADALEGRWTTLELTKRRPGGQDSTLWVNTLRQDRPYDPGIQEVADLERFFDYRKAGRYDHIPAIAALSGMAATSLAIRTPDLDDYREFLETVAMFLEFSNGVVVSPRETELPKFRAEFLDD
jgi:hypothetical protein